MLFIISLKLTAWFVSLGSASNEFIVLNNIQISEIINKIFELYFLISGAFAPNLGVYKMGLLQYFGIGLGYCDNSFLGLILCQA